MEKNQTWPFPSSTNSVDLDPASYARPSFEKDNLANTTVVIADQPFIFTAFDPDLPGNPEYVYQLDTSINFQGGRFDYTFLADFPTTWATNGQGGSGSTYIRRVSDLEGFLKGDPIELEAGNIIRLDHTLIREGAQRWLVNTTTGGTGTCRIYNQIGDIIHNKTGGVSFLDVPPNTIAQCTYVDTMLYIDCELRITKLLTAADPTPLTRNFDYIFNISSDVTQPIANLDTLPQGRTFTVLNGSENGSEVLLEAASGTKLNGIVDGKLVLKPAEKREFVANGSRGIFYSNIQRNQAFELTWTVAADTDFSIANPSKVAGTTALDYSERFTMTDNNEVTYNCVSGRYFLCMVDLSATGGNNDEIRYYLRKFDTSGGVYVDQQFIEITQQGNNDAVNFSIGYIVYLDPGDRLELWAQNISDTDSIEVQVGGSIVAKEI